MMKIRFIREMDRLGWIYQRRLYVKLNLLRKNKSNKINISWIYFKINNNKKMEFKMEKLLLELKIKKQKYKKMYIFIRCYF